MLGTSPGVQLSLKSVVLCVYLGVLGCKLSRSDLPCCSSLPCWWVQGSRERSTTRAVYVRYGPLHLSCLHPRSLTSSVVSAYVAAAAGPAALFRHAAWRFASYYRSATARMSSLATTGRHHTLVVFTEVFDRISSRYVHHVTRRRPVVP